jgi:3-oxoacyl-[acyl-carrier protein] reductase
MKLNLVGKLALVTGADRRTGEVIAQTLAGEGCHTIVHSLDTLLDAERAVVGDLRTETGRLAVINQLTQNNWMPDILVNNYGITDNHTWDDTGEDKWLEMYHTNALSAIRLAQAMAPTMKARGWGRIVHLGTIGSHQPAAERPAYYAAKGALSNATVSHAQALRASGVTVNTVAPGLIRTEDTEAIFTKIARKRGWSGEWSEIEARVSAELFPNLTGRMVSRQEVADLVAFICSPLAGSITGQTLRIDGGAVLYI